MATRWPLPPSKDSQRIVGGSGERNGTIGRCPGGHPPGAIRSARGWQRSDAATTTTQCHNSAVGPQSGVAVMAQTASIAELQLCPALVAKSRSIAADLDSILATRQLARVGCACPGQLSRVVRRCCLGRRTLHGIVFTCGRRTDGNDSA